MVDYDTWLMSGYEADQGCDCDRPQCEACYPLGRCRLCEAGATVQCECCEKPLCEKHCHTTSTAIAMCVCDECDPRPIVFKQEKRHARHAS